MQTSQFYCSICGKPIKAGEEGYCLIVFGNTRCYLCDNCAKEYNFLWKENKKK